MKRHRFIRPLYDPDEGRMPEREAVVAMRNGGGKMILRCANGSCCHGRMKFTGKSSGSGDFEHRCDLCLGVEWMRHIYPRMA